MPPPPERKGFARLTESRWTVLFIFTALTQACIVFFLESVILERTLHELVHIQAFHNETSLIPILAGKDPKNSIGVAEERFRWMKWENVWFMTFQIWISWIAVDSIYNQNTVEIISLATINILCAIYAIIQVSELVKWRVNIDALGITVDEIFTAERLAIAMMILIIIFAIELIYLSWQLYRQFGWSIYKKIGADKHLRVMYRIFQMYVLVLKLDVYFEFATTVFFVIESIAELIYTGQRDHFSIVIHSLIALLIIPALIGARRAVAQESLPLVSLAVVFQLVVFINFAFMMKETIRPNHNWAFWIFVVTSGLIVSFLTTLGGLLTMRNFEKGLIRFVQINSDHEQLAPVPRFDLESDSYSTPSLKPSWEEIGMTEGNKEDRETLIVKEVL